MNNPRIYNKEHHTEAWKETMQWYANCIVSSMDRSVSYIDVFRWCSKRNIDTAELEAICVKHGIDVQEIKDTMEKDVRSKVFKCMVPITAVLNPETDINRHTLNNPELLRELGLEADTYTITYTYPLTHSVGRSYQINENTTLMDLAKLVANDYKTIYEEEAASTKVMATDTQKLPNGMTLDNRNTTDGVHGIWGHVISDLWIEYFVVDEKFNAIYLHIGS